MARKPGRTENGAARGRPRDPAGGPKRAVPWLQGLVCGGLIAFAPAVALLLGALLLPGLIAWTLDTSRGRGVGRGAIMCGVAASVGSLLPLWRQGVGWEHCVALATDLDVLAPAWLAAGAGWLTGELSPHAIRLVLDIDASAHVASLRAARQTLEQEWGLPPATEGEAGSS